MSRGNMSKKIFIITGEYSGDKHASGVVRELKKLYSDAIIEGIGGENLKNQGVKLFCDHSKMAGIGITPKLVIDHFTLGRRIVDYLKNDFRPDIVLLVDYGAFNLAISKFLKKEGFRVLYFIPPQVWASRKWRIKTIKKNVDKVFTIFPFEKQMYDNEGINAEFVGHPLNFELPAAADRNEFFERHGLDKNKRLVSVFPGSRMFEIKYLLNIFKGAVKIIEKACPDVQFVFSHATNLKDDAFNTEYKTIKGENQALLSVSDALILASGTVALEAALYKTPMIIAYRGPLVFYLIYLIVRSIKNACLVNIITGKDIVKEFLMYDAKSDKIAKEIIKLLDDKEYRQKQICGLTELNGLMGDKHCVEECAKILNEELRGE